MKFSFSDFLFLVTMLFTTLSGGVFFTWAATVVPGLAKLSDANYLAAMQSMNREIQNPVFFLCFFGAAILLPVSAWQQFGTGSFWWMASAAAVYLIGVMAVSVFVNVPLNSLLESSGLATADLSHLRKMFETRWNSGNLVRAFASVLAIALTLISAMKR